MLVLKVVSTQFTVKCVNTDDLSVKLTVSCMETKTCSSLYECDIRNVQYNWILAIVVPCSFNYPSKLLICTLFRDSSLSSNHKLAFRLKQMLKFLISCSVLADGFCSHWKKCADILSIPCITTRRQRSTKNKRLIRFWGRFWFSFLVSLHFETPRVLASKLDAKYHECLSYTIQ